MEFFKYFFRVLHEASSSWLKLFRVFRLHPGLSQNTRSLCQYLILHIRESRSLGNRKNYLKSTTATLQGNDVRVYLCLHCM
jgi:hypothetical protein